MTEAKPRTLVMIDITDDDSDPLTPDQWADFNENIWYELSRLPSFGLRSNTYSHATDRDRRVIYTAWVDTAALEHLRVILRRVRQKFDISSVGLALLDNMELV